MLITIILIGAEIGLAIYSVGSTIVHKKKINDWAMTLIQGEQLMRYPVIHLSDLEEDEKEKKPDDPTVIYVYD